MDTWSNWDPVRVLVNFPPELLDLYKRISPVSACSINYFSLMLSYRQGSFNPRADLLFLKPSLCSICLLSSCCQPIESSFELALKKNVLSDIPKNAKPNLRGSLGSGLRIHMNWSKLMTPWGTRKSFGELDLKYFSFLSFNITYLDCHDFSHAGESFRIVPNLSYGSRTVLSWKAEEFRASLILLVVVSLMGATWLFLYFWASLCYWSSCF